MLIVNDDAGNTLFDGNAGICEEVLQSRFSMSVAALMSLARIPFSFQTR